MWMNKLFATVGLISILASGSLYAENACQGFRVKIKNNLEDDIRISSTKIEDGKFEPHGVITIGKKSEGIVYLAKANSSFMLATIGAQQLNFPFSTFKVTFTLTDSNSSCVHKPVTHEGNMHVESQDSNEVVYTIG